MEIVYVAFLGATPGMGELILVFAVVLLVFGANRMPEIARTIGRTLEELRRAADDFKRHIQSEVDLREDVDFTVSDASVSHGELSSAATEDGDDNADDKPAERPPSPGDDANADDDPAERPAKPSESG